MYIAENGKKRPYPIVTFYIVLIVLNLIFIKAPIENKEFNENENMHNFVEIFGVNKTIITEKKKDLIPDEIEILKQTRDRLDFSKDKIEFLVDSEQLYWTYSFLRYINYEDFLDDTKYSGQQRLSLKSMHAEEKIGEVDYMVYFKRSSYYEENAEKLFENSDIIYENDARRNSKI